MLNESDRELYIERSLSRKLGYIPRLLPAGVFFLWGNNMNIKLILTIALLMILSACSSTPEYRVVEAMQAPKMVTPVIVEAQAPEPVDIYISPRPVKHTVLTHNNTAKHLEENPGPWAYWCYDETSVLNLNKWVGDHGQAIEKLLFEIDTLRAIIDEQNKRLRDTRRRVKEHNDAIMAEGK